MATNKSKKLAQQIWAIANSLRGNMDAAKFKDYILGVIFYRYLSAHTESYMDDLLKNDCVTYREALANPELREEVQKWAIEKLGYLIEPDDLFDSLVEQINEGKFTIERFEKAITKLTESTIGQPSETAFANLFDAMNLKDSDLGKTVSERTKLMATIITKIYDTPFAKNSDSGDVLGTAYMILIGFFQSGAGKKGGEFFSPTCACILLSQLTTLGLDEVKNVSDGCAGSGSLLLEVSKQLKSHKVHHYYAQESIGATYNLLRMNFIMHGVDYKDFTVFNDDTLTTDNFYENGEPIKFDIQVENPPYSAPNTASASKYLDDPRYRSAGVLAPKSKADLQFVESVVYHMSENGRAAILLPHGALFRGESEQTIRKYLIDNLNVVDAIIGLPANMFHGTGIPVCVLYLKRDRNGDSDNILFIDASKGFEKIGKNNVLRASDIKRIVDCVRERSDIEKFSRKVSMSEIKANDYNLNIPRYVDSAEEIEPWDLYSLMHGGVPEGEVERFKPYFDVFLGLKDELFTKKGVAYTVNGDVKKICRNNRHIEAYVENYESAIQEMRSYLKSVLLENVETLYDKLSDTEEKITKELFTKVSGIPFVDKYDAYQALYDEWEQISKDAEIIHTDGIKSLKEVEFVKVLKKIDGEKKEIDSKEKEGKILPFALVQRILFAGELAKVETLRAELAEKEAELTEAVESLTDDEKDYEVDVNRKKKIETKKIYDKEKNAIAPVAIEAAYKMLKKEYDGELDFDEGTVENKIVKIRNAYEAKKGANTSVNNADKALLNKTIKTIESLDDNAAFALLEKKWIDSFIDNVSGLAKKIMNDLMNRIYYMVKKYEIPYANEDSEIKDVESGLAKLLKDIKGTESDNLGIEEWLQFLGGN